MIEETGDLPRKSKGDEVPDKFYFEDQVSHIFPVSNWDNFRKMESTMESYVRQKHYRRWELHTLALVESVCIQLGNGFLCVAPTAKLSSTPSRPYRPSEPGNKVAQPRSYVKLSQR